MAKTPFNSLHKSWFIPKLTDDTYSKILTNHLFRLC